METGKAEGGDYHPKPGAADQNPTRKGVTQNRFTKWLSDQGLPSRDIFTATDDEIFAVYREHWNDAHCGELPYLVALPCFDMSINGGPARAIAIFQQASGFAGDPVSFTGDCDGKWGPKTRDAAYRARQDERRWAHRVQNYRLSFYVRIADQPNELPNLRSWVRRVIDFNLKFLA